MPGKWFCLPFVCNSPLSSCIDKGHWLSSAVESSWLSQRRRLAWCRASPVNAKTALHPVFLESVSANQTLISSCTSLLRANDSMYVPGDEIWSRCSYHILSATLLELRRKCSLWNEDTRAIRCLLSLLPNLQRWSVQTFTCTDFAIVAQWLCDRSAVTYDSNRVDSLAPACAELLLIYILLAV